MAEQKQSARRWIVAVTSLFPANWFGSTGERFRNSIEEIAEFSSRQQLPAINDEAPDLAWRKMEGIAHREHATALKEFAEAESRRIEIELERRSLKAEVSRAQAEARLAEIRALEAEIEFVSKLKEIGVIVVRNEHGDLTVLPAPANYDYDALAERIRKEGASDGPSSG